MKIKEYKVLENGDFDLVVSFSAEEMREEGGLDPDWWFELDQRKRFLKLCLESIFKRGE